jgi:hypothetical protein
MCYIPLYGHIAGLVQLTIEVVVGVLAYITVLLRRFPSNEELARLKEAYNLAVSVNEGYAQAPVPKVAGLKVLCVGVNIG